MELSEKKRLIKQAMRDARGYQMTTPGFQGNKCPDNERTNFWVQQIIDALPAYFAGNVFEAQKNLTKGFSPQSEADSWYKTAYAAGMKALCNIEISEKKLTPPVPQPPVQPDKDPSELTNKIQNLEAELAQLKQSQAKSSSSLEISDNPDADLDEIFAKLKR